MDSIETVVTMKVCGFREISSMARTENSVSTMVEAEGDRFAAR